jgi:hypothetical protein
MRYIKTLGLLAVAAAALMAFAGTASATSLTSPAGTTYTSTISATSTNSTLHGSFITVTCKHSAVTGKVESHGAAVTAGGKISSLTFSECNYPVTVSKPGSLEIHTEYELVKTHENGTKTYAQKATSNGNGTLTSTGAEIKIHTSVGECIFTTSATDIGLLTGSTTKNAVLDIDSSAIPRTGGSFFCGSSGEWTGNYTVTTPSTLYVH